VLLQFSAVVLSSLAVVDVNLSPVRGNTVVSVSGIRPAHQTLISTDSTAFVTPAAAKATLG